MSDPGKPRLGSERLGNDPPDHFGPGKARARSSSPTAQARDDSARVPNPYDPPAEVDAAKVSGNVAETARLLRSSFLYRRVEFDSPFKGTFVYNGWNFLQRIFVNDALVWRRISWVTIHRQAVFELPPQVDPQQRTGEMRILFSRGMAIRRFTVTIGETTVYDEFHPGL